MGVPKVPEWRSSRSKREGRVCGVFLLSGSAVKRQGGKPMQPLSKGQLSSPEMDTVRPEPFRVVCRGHRML